MQVGGNQVRRKQSSVLWSKVFVAVNPARSHEYSFQVSKPAHFSGQMIDSPWKDDPGLNEKECFARFPWVPGWQI